ncbi:hypothetical protein F2P56_001854 [Juglans regia]|uniref:Coumaroyl-CoA:anthocyanidin 3-O-glucoside-6''-O-coumaroyltransferase 1-like n=2 Tax=Juglans regia TaxID=51240 RepID=A0A2I4G1T6_JUGRE|nr:coumaroyl-CoA:anthocyanidin 3-O-glucoside-6''-O-coumaroyltransferase 1-like [Juglans regia]KAF5481182.1 hypothetical protein F2P56_001854 [Juglans regia]
MAQPYRVVVLEQNQVAPPPNSVPTTSLPLTFFDIPWLLCPPMQRLFFYDLPQPTNHFVQVILPSLKHSLSITLQHFFPFAADLICPPQPLKPHLLYAEGNSVPLTIAECADDFRQLIANCPRDVRELHPFVAQLPPARVSSDNTRVIPLMSMQVTVFPNKGICIGITFCHVTADGRAFHHFIKSWASIFRSRGDLTFLATSPPLHEKAVIKDLNGLEPIFLEEWWKWASTWKEEDSVLIHDILANKVRATFVLGRAHIENLKHRVTSECTTDLKPLHTSTFVVACALIWVCLIKSQNGGVSNFANNDKLYYFNFVADCRNRVEFPIPSTYFGNCLAICFVSLAGSELVGETGFFKAVKVIGDRVSELESGALRGAERWLLDWKEISELGRLVTVAGSPRLGIYDTDFGWGRPKKSEVVQIDVSGAISLAECRDEDGAIEVGLSLSRTRMNSFNAIFEQSLKLL